MDATVADAMEEVAEATVVVIAEAIVAVTAIASKHIPSTHYTILYTIQ